MATAITSLFASVQLTGATTTIYSVPAAPPTTVLRLGRVRFTNTDTVTRAVTAYAVPAAGTAGATNQFMNAETIAANAHLDVDLPLLGAGAFLQAFADVTLKVTVLPLDGILFS